MKLSLCFLLILQSFASKVSIRFQPKQNVLDLFPLSLHLSIYQHFFLSYLTVLTLVQRAAIRGLKGAADTVILLLSFNPLQPLDGV